MKISSKTHYGLMACHILGKNYPDNPISASTMESYFSVSGKYIEKIMRILTKRGIVTATRGTAGGYFLARSPEQITIGEVVRALEDDMEIIECVKESANCKCCPQANVWKKLYAGINKMLDSMTVKDLLEGNI